MSETARHHTVSSTTNGTAAAAPDAPFVLREDHGAVAHLTLNRPAARNALSLALLAELRETIEAVGRDVGIRAVVLEGSGPAFCAGHDLKEMSAARTQEDGGRAFFELTMRSCSALMQAIVACPKPVIAAVDGIATAAGCQLVATCDLAVSSTASRFATPGVNIGLFCSTPMVALSRNVGRKQAMEMLLLGEMIDAEQALAWGLVNRVVAVDEVRPTAMALARQIADKSQVTIAYGKEAFYRQAEAPLSEAYDLTARVMVENMMARDAEEGIGAFLGKRATVWSRP